MLRRVLRWVAPMVLWCLSVGSHAQSQDPQALYAVIDSERGQMEFVLRTEIAPLTVANFVNLALRGFYDGLTFHRVEPNFMAQGGDPAGDGSGGPGYRFKDETALKLNQEGILAMANAGKDTNGSQFFITHQAVPHLNGVHTVFGLIQKGKEVIKQIKIGDKINRITIVGDTKPLLQAQSQSLAEWNRILDQNFPTLRSAP
jgi:peptidyl-prolyl cis-trans isomerase B (cyclophilin B)